MKLDALGIDDSAAERDIDSSTFRAFLQLDVEYSLKRLEKSVSVRRIAQHIVQPDEQIEVREQRFHGRLEVKNGLHRTMQNSIRCEHTERLMERLAFLRVLGERKMPISMYEVELQEHGCTSQVGKRGIRMRTSATHGFLV